MSIAERIMNVIIYGNPDGTPTFRGKCSTKYDDFIKQVFYQDKTKELTDLFWEKYAKHSEDFDGLERFLAEKMK